MVFRKLNNSIKNCHLARLCRFLGRKSTEPLAQKGASRGGQVAIVLILVIAIALIFYAVALNLGRITQQKTQITIASNSAAGMLASQVASYGQQKYMVELGGRFKRCGFTGLGRILISALVVILAVVTFGISLSATMIVLLSLLAAGGIAIDLVAVQPGVNTLWGKHTELSLDTISGALEAGIRLAVQSAASDRKLVLDEYDTDFDGIWGGTVEEPDDVVGRFVLYYNERMKSIQGISIPILEQFVEELSDLVFADGPDDFGFYDPVGCDFSCCYEGGETVPTVCNECCLPFEVTFPQDGDPDTNDEYVVPVRPTCCNPPCDSFDDFLSGECTQWPECGLVEPCGRQTNNASNPGSQFPQGTYDWDYQKYYENPTNNIGSEAVISFREFLGRDDEARSYFKRFNKNFDDEVGWLPADDMIEQNYISEHPRNSDPHWEMMDATGYWNWDTEFGGLGFGLTSPQRRPGIYPYFYKIRDWGLDLSGLDISDTTEDATHCYWFDDEYTDECDQEDTDRLFHIELMTQKLELTLDPTDETLIKYNTAARVDGLGDPYPVDKVTIPLSIVSEHIDNNYCAQKTLYPAPRQDEGFWKEGADRYCSGNWPYAEQCPKTGFSGGVSGCFDEDSEGNMTVARDCVCDEDNAQSPSAWPDDPIDDLVYASDLFIEWAQSLIGLELSSLERDFVFWYPDAAEWIERGFVSGAVEGSTCYTCNENDGILWQWLYNLEQMHGRLLGFLEEDYGGDSCEEVWCAPDPDLTCDKIKADERASMGSASLYSEDSGDILDCLDHNINFEGPTGAPGNAARFTACHDACLNAVSPDNPRYPLGTTQDYIDSNFACGDNENTFLPRSMVPDFDPSGQFIQADIEALTPYTECPDYCRNSDPDNLGCMDQCEILWGECTDVCDAANVACVDGCDGDPDCIATCGAAHSDCIDATCDDDQTGCFENCECEIGTETYECNQSENDLLIELNDDAEISAKGTCRWDQFSPVDTVINPDAAAGGFFDLIEESAREAANQLDKFEHRRKFLQARVNETLHIMQGFEEAATKLENFLRGVAAQVVQERINFNDERLPDELIYGWRSDPKPNEVYGAWHIVRVEAKVPSKCDDNCDANQTGPQDWPSSKTYRRAFGIQRCFELINTDGTVKVRVTRYDEDKTPNPLFFPNGAPIWDFRNHPDRDAVNSAENLHVSCPPFTSEKGTTFEGAFLVNGPDWVSETGSDNGTCYGEAIELLNNFGVQSETCAKYYHHGGTDALEGFDFQFVPCKPF